MNDDFQFGERAKHPARLRRTRPPGAKRSLVPRLLVVAAGLAVAGALAFVLLDGAADAGRQIGEDRSETIAQIDRAYDAAAQGTMGRAVVVAQSLYAEHGSFTTDVDTLSAYDPGLRFVSGPSNAPTTLSYAVSGGRFGAAVRSESGTCWWVRIDTSSVTTYGSGTPCSGSAALQASAPSW